MRGREKFKKYKLLIEMVTALYSIFPKRILKLLLVHHRKTTGTKGMLLRYALLKNLANHIGENVSIHPDVYLFNVEKLRIGDNVSIHPLCYFEAYGGIEIGNDVSIAHNVSILSVSHNYKGSDIPIKDQGLTAKPVIISNNVWIGAKVTVLGGVKIGSGSIIGSGAVVTKNIGNNKVAVGVPANNIKDRLL